MTTTTTSNEREKLRVVNEDLPRNEGDRVREAVEVVLVCHMEEVEQEEVARQVDLKLLLLLVVQVVVERYDLWRISASDHFLGVMDNFFVCIF